jgi:PEP-CTERM motif-containing protein
MKRFSWFIALPSLLIPFLALPPQARADTIITLQAAPGTDLSNIHVGDTIVLDTIASSTDVGEHLISFPDVHILGFGDVSNITGSFASTVFDDLTTDPVIVVWSMLAAGPGPVEVFNGWPDCVGLPGDTSGCAVTNLGATRPADSNRLDFTITTPVPEPGTLGLVGLGLAFVGKRLRKMRKPT